MFTKIVLTLLISSISLLANERGEEIAEMNLKARGGKSKIAQISDYRFETSTLNAVNGVEDSSLLMFNDSAFFIEQLVNGKRTVFAHNGENSWFVAPFLGIDSVTDMTDQWRMQFEAQFRQTLSFMKGIFYGYKQDSITIDYLSDIKVDGVEYHKLSLYRQKGGLTVEVLIDKKSKFEKKLIIKAPMGITTIIFDDHKKVDGVIFPHKLITYLGDQHVSTLTFNKIFLNRGINPEIFEKPKR